MNTVIKAIASVFVFGFITYLGSGFINAQVDASTANSFMVSAKSEIADANLSGNVIEAVKSQAAENGYQMESKVYEKDGEPECVQLTMTYKYQIPILGVKNEHIIRGYVN